MPYYAVSDFELKRFRDPLGDSRVVQRSDYVFEQEIPLRTDMIPGAIYLKEYDGRFVIKVELLYDRFPDSYLYAAQFRQEAAHGHVAVDKLTHERWL